MSVSESERAPQPGLTGGQKRTLAEVNVRIGVLLLLPGMPQSPMVPSASLPRQMMPFQRLTCWFLLQLTAHAAIQSQGVIRYVQASATFQLILSLIHI